MFSLLLILTASLFHCSWQVDLLRFIFRWILVCRDGWTYASVSGGRKPKPSLVRNKRGRALLEALLSGRASGRTPRMHSVPAVVGVTLLIITEQRDLACGRYGKRNDHPNESPWRACPRPQPNFPLVWDDISVSGLRLWTLPLTMHYLLSDRRDVQFRARQHMEGRIPDTLPPDLPKGLRGIYDEVISCVGAISQSLPRSVATLNGGLSTAISILYLIDGSVLIVLANVTMNVTAKLLLLPLVFCRWRTRANSSTIDAWCKLSSARQSSTL